jgi:hypothetical protein
MHPPFLNKNKKRTIAMSDRAGMVAQAPPQPIRWNGGSRLRLGPLKAPREFTACFIPHDGQAAGWGSIVKPFEFDQQRASASRRRELCPNSHNAQRLRRNPPVLPDTACLSGSHKQRGPLVRLAGHARVVFTLIWFCNKFLSTKPRWLTTFAREWDLIEKTPLVPTTPMGFYGATFVHW